MLGGSLSWWWNCGCWGAAEDEEAPEDVAEEPPVAVEKAEIPPFLFNLLGKRSEIPRTREDNDDNNNIAPTSTQLNPGSTVAHMKKFGRRKAPPEGWSDIEPTIKEFERKLREGKPHWQHLKNRFLIMLGRWSFFCLQPKMNRTKVKESSSPPGQSSKSTTSAPATFTTCSTPEKPSAATSTNGAWRRAWLTPL